MGFYERIDARGVRETGRPVSFVPKGALTHPPRSGRWYCLRQPCALRGGCGSCGSLMSNATILWDCCHCPCSRLEVLLYPQNRGMAIRHPFAVCLRQSCRWQVCRREGVAVHDTLFFFLRKRNKKPRTKGR